jgi:hypothetical protein
MKSIVNTKKQEQYKKFIAKEAAFLKKVVGGENNSTEKQYDDTKIMI